MSWKKVLAVGQLCRGVNSLALSLLFFAMANAAHAGSEIERLAGGLAWFMSAACAYALNDLVDIEIDRVNRPKRPLPSSKITRRQAKTVIVVTALLSLLITLAWRSGFVWIAGSLCLSVFYSMWLRPRSALWSNVVASVLAASVPLSALVAVRDRGWLLIPAVVLALILARELQKDVVDAIGDRTKRPVAVMLKFYGAGATWFYRLLILTAITLVLGAAALLPIPVQSRALLAAGVIGPLLLSLLLSRSAHGTAALDARLIKVASYCLVGALILVSTK